ncbi:MAG: MBL fold metallo-hydrolase [Myxococcota bacterium]
MLIPKFCPKPEHRPLLSGGVLHDADRLTIRWLGTAGHIVSSSSTTVLIDPFLSRPGLLRTAFSKLIPQTELYEDWLPDRVDAVLVGHSHYDHLMDAPSIAYQKRCPIMGSATSMCFAQSAGVPLEHQIEVPASGLTRQIGDIQVRFVPSLHAKLLAGTVPFDGERSTPAPTRPRIYHYRMGGAFGIHLKVGGRSVYHNGSADLVDAELEGVQADIALIGIAGRYATRDYIERLTSLLEPKVVIPSHYDYFFAPLEAGIRLLPSIDLPGFVREVSHLSPEAVVRTPLFEEELVVPLEGDPRDAGVVPL